MSWKFLMSDFIHRTGPSFDITVALGAAAGRRARRQKARPAASGRGSRPRERNHKSNNGGKLETGQESLALIFMSSIAGSLIAMPQRVVEVHFGPVRVGRGVPTASQPGADVRNAPLLATSRVRSGRFEVSYRSYLPLTQWLWGRIEWLWGRIEVALGSHHSGFRVALVALGSHWGGYPLVINTL